MASKLKKLEQIVFYLIIVLLPTQLGRHFWPEFSYVYGLRIDYLSPTIYLTDVLILTLLLLALINTSFFKKFNLKRVLANKAWILVWAFSLICGILVSKNILAGTYGLMKISEFVFFGYYVSKALNQKKIFKNTMLFLGIGVLSESILAFIQFLAQGSLGGLLYFLGERSFTGQTPGIANTSLGGQLILRPYATFSHPNVLAAFLLISLLFIIFTLLAIKEIREKIFFSAVVIIGSVALLVTMSRIAIVLYFLTILFLLFLKKQKKLIALIVFLTMIIVISPVKLRFLNFRIDELAVTQRQDLITSSLLMVKENLVLGTGVNNFINNVPFYSFSISTFNFQPVHNIYLLILSQTGVIGIIFFLWFLKKTIFFILNAKQERKIHGLKTLLIIVFLLLGFFDHYFLTIQQGQMLFAFVFGFLWTDIKSIS